MSTLTHGRITAAEFARMPQPADGSKQELVKGVIITMPPPSFEHGVVCSRFDRKVGNFVDERQLGFVTCNDSGAVLSEDTVRGPDVAYWSKARLPVRPRTTYPDVVPDLVVEVPSPDDAFRTLFTNVDEYLRAGVRLVWVAIPEDRSVGVFTPDRKQVLLTEKDTLSGGDVLPGFSCLVGDLFA
jgi:Uma2 family endonuclease